MQPPNVIPFLTELLRDNVGNRLTAALANGILLAVSQELNRQAQVPIPETPSDVV